VTNKPTYVDFTVIVIVRGLTSPPTQYRLYGRRFLQVKKAQPTVSKYWRHTDYTFNRKAQ